MAVPFICVLRIPVSFLVYRLLTPPPIQMHRLSPPLDLSGESIAVCQVRPQPLGVLRGVPVHLPPPPGASSPVSLLPTQLSPFDVVVGSGELGLGDDLGYTAGSEPTGDAAEAASRRKISINGEALHKCISMHPPDNGSAKASFRLAGLFKKLSFATAINDDVTESLCDITFEVYGDGKRIWASQPTRKVAGGACAHPTCFRVCVCVCVCVCVFARVRALFLPDCLAVRVCDVQMPVRRTCPASLST